MGTCRLASHDDWPSRPSLSDNKPSGVITPCEGVITPAASHMCEPAGLYDLLEASSRTATGSSDLTGRDDGS